MKLSNDDRANDIERVRACFIAAGVERTLSERMVQKTTGLDRRRIRAAFARLEEEGFVVYYPHIGHRALLCSREQVSQILDIRFVIESHSIRVGCERGATFRALIPACTALEKAVKKLTDLLATCPNGWPPQKAKALAEQLNRADIDMHAVLLDEAGLANDVLYYLRGRVLTQHAFDLAQDPERGKRRAAQILTEHREWMAALLSDSPDKADVAIALLKKHMDRGKGSPLRMVGDDHTT